MLNEAIYESPIGKMLIVASDKGVAEISFLSDSEEGRGVSGNAADLPETCLRQLDEYFSGKRKNFDLPLDLKGTPFQLSVWRVLLLIPFGDTWSYGKVAGQIGKPKASRAVGGANHRNPVSIIVPCHRVVGSGGDLTGYGGGLWRKEWLIEHERKIRL
jgi:methylated-DNA-[protein]-cysteine S-methyltransferase